MIDKLNAAIRLHDEHLVMKGPPSMGSQKRLQRLLKEHKVEMKGIPYPMSSKSMSPKKGGARKSASKSSPRR